MSIQLSSKSLITLLMSFAFLVGCTAADQPAEVVADASPPMDSLVTVEWLKDHLDDPDLVVLDCSVVVERDGQGGSRTVSGRQSYEAGHIPTAGFADLKG